MAIGIELEKILVVEDRAEQREEILEDLSDAGYIVRGAANSRQAVKAFKEFRPQLVLMDIHMGKPGEMDGVGIAGMLRDTNLPFALIFLTGYEYSYKGTKHLDPQDFLRKSKVTTSEDLLERIEIAWGAYQKSNEKMAHTDRVAYRFKVAHEEFLDERKGEPNRYSIRLENSSRKVRISDAILLKVVKGVDKQVQLFMEDGRVFRVARSLKDIVKSANLKHLVQIRGNIVVNVKKVNDIYSDDFGDYRVVIPTLEKTFGNYFRLSKGNPHKIGFSDLYLSRTFKDKGVVEKIDALLQEKG